MRPPHSLFPPRLLLVVLAGFLVILQGSAHADSAEGRYTATVEGQALSLVLSADGSATLGALSGTWKQVANKVTLTGNGESQAFRFDGRSLKATVDGFSLVFLRETVRPNTAGTKTTTTGNAFRPKLLKGKRFKVPEANASFTLPNGWRGAAGSAGDLEGILLKSKQAKGAAIVIVAKLLNSQEQAASVPDLLRHTVEEELGDTPVNVIQEPQGFTIGGHAAGQLAVEGRQGGTTMRMRAGGVRVGRWGVLFVALYPAKLDASVKPVFETVLGSFKAKAPKENLKLRAKLAGCWQHVSASGGGTGSAYSETTFRFDAAGNYSYQHMTSISVGGGGSSNIAKEAGTFSVFGSELTTQSNEGKSSSYSPRLQRGRLFLGSVKYSPCS